MNRSICIIAAIMCVQLVTAFNILESGKSSLFKMFHHAKADSMDWNDRPRRDQKSLLIVFDTTQSMDRDLEQLRYGATDIVNNFAVRKDQPIYNYVLSLFNDPAVEVPLVSRNFTIILKRLNEVVVRGGGDCPELALTGLRNAIDSGLSNSPAFLFSDASAKDYELYDEVAALIQRKQTNVNFFLTGDCDSRTTPQYKVYSKIARTSGGQVFNLDRTSVREVLVATSVSLESDFVNLQSVEFDVGGKSETLVELDESIRRISVILSGSDAQLSVEGPSGDVIATAKSSPEVFSSANIKIITFDVSSMKYTIKANASSEYSLRIGGISDLKFEFGFSRKMPGSISDTHVRPTIGSPSILSVYISDKSLVKNLVHATIVPATSLEPFDDFQVTLKRNNNGFYLSDPFEVPTQMFRIQIHGSDSKDNKIDRVISTGITASSGIAPEVEIDFKRLSAPKNGKLTLDCNVKSLTSVEIQWKFNVSEVSEAAGQVLDTKTSDESISFSYELKNLKEENVGFYSCVAENELGKESMKVFVDICSPDDDPQCKSFAFGMKISKTLLLSALFILSAKMFKL